MPADEAGIFLSVILLMKAGSHRAGSGGMVPAVGKELQKEKSNFKKTFQNLLTVY